MEDPLSLLREPIARILANLAAVEGTETWPLEKAAGRVLVQPIAAMHAVPPFDQAAMDGYALGAGDDTHYRLAGRLAAGDAAPQPLGSGEAARIFTGAPVPAGARAVIQQERATAGAGWLEAPPGLPAGLNIRRAGEDVAAGGALLPGGQRLRPRHIGLAAAAGHLELPVRRKLRVALASTGAELRGAGSSLGPAQIHDSNRPMLRAMLEAPDVELLDLGILADEPAALSRSLALAAETADLVVSSGGVSAGEEDHMLRAIADAGGEVEVVRLPIKPGKPVKFGRIGRSAVLALPGNPLAAFIIQWLVGCRMLDVLAGTPPRALRASPARLGFEEAVKPGERVEFVPLRIVATDEMGLPIVERLGRGSSARLLPLSQADAIGIFGPGTSQLQRGKLVGILPVEE
ncbi:molybdopterin molybdotransferase MoeA [Roseococcus sp. YIM B11640]|uniref:molybdopterin molybdotransferase MoeA n=1 Tax=Roseococcus sp. YIM B11640 TaxID=3133973 RepID=UPI003C7A9AFF